tara:strand:+ start:305 stop:511 length:207 start_codon:yes stop_codon:yes gene_type:complete
LWDEIEAIIKSDLTVESADFIGKYLLIKETAHGLVLLCDLKIFETFINFIHKSGVQEAYNLMGVRLKV